MPSFIKVICLLGLGVSLAGCKLSSETVLSTVPSPDGKLVAKVVYYDPGAIGEPFSQVYVHAATEKDEATNRMLAVDYGCPLVVNWTGNKALRAIYDCPPSAIEIAIWKENDITVEYVQKPLPPIHSSFVP